VKAPTKSQLIDENSELRRQLTALKSTIAKISPAIVSSTGATVHEADGESQRIAERFDLALRATNSAIWDWDIENKQFWSSSGHQLLFGRGDDEITEFFDIEDDDNPWTLRLHPEDCERAKRCLIDHLENDAPYDVDYRYRLPSGEYIWIRSVGRATRTPDGRPLRMVGLNSNITAKKLVEIGSERFREAVDNASEGVVIYDADERFVYANKRYREMVPAIAHLLKPGTHREEVRQTFVSTGTLSTDADTAEQFMGEMRRSQSIGGTAELQLANGLWMKRSDYILPDGAVVSIRTEITEIKQRERALRDSEARFRAIFEGADFGIVIANLDGHVLSCNPAFTTMMGYELGELDGVPWSEYTHPDDNAENTLLFDQLVRGECTSFQMEKRYIRKDGDVLWVNLTVSVIGDEVDSPPFSVGLIENISERKKAEKALRKSKANLEEAQRTAQIGDWEYNVETEEMAWSAQIYRIFETSPDEYQPTVEWFYEFVHPDDLEHLRRMVSDAEHTKEHASYEYRIILSSGEIRWILQESALIDDVMSASGRRHGTVQNITERKIAENALRESEQNLSNIAANIADSVVTIDETGTILSFNQAAERAFGYIADEIVGGRVEQLVPEPHAARHHQYINGYLETGQSAILGKGPRELEGQHKDGSTFPIELAISEMKVGGRRTFIGTMRDIVQRKQIEEALREREQMLRGIFDTAAIGISVNDQEGRYIQFNPAYEKMLGFTAEELSTKTFSDVTHPDDHDLEAPHIADLLADRVASYQFDKRYIHKNGSTIWVSVHVANLKDAAGSVIGSLATVEDITERKLTEEKYLHAQKMEAVGQLTGGVAHDFNNLLTVILGNLELIHDRVSDDEATLAMIERGVKASERGAALTHRLLAFSRKQTLMPTNIDASTLVADMTDMLRRTLGETIEITTGGQEELWLCNADQPQLENALLNLSINARDAMADGGRLTIETANISLDDEGAAAQADVELGDYVLLSVSDTGSGIAEETLKHVVEPFFTTKEVGAGSGLGLSMVYGFAKQSGGAVTIHSQLEEGTTVKLYLPRAIELRDETHATEGISDIPKAQGENVLVVEDDADVRQLAVGLLSDLGYEISEAGSAEAALDVLKKNSAFDLLLSDVVLPGAMNGPDLGAEVRRRYSITNIVYMTGYAKDAFNGHAELDDRSHVIQKPFKKEDLAVMIRSVLDGDKAPV